jgi:hypothetical protein
LFFAMIIVTRKIPVIQVANGARLNGFIRHYLLTPAFLAITFAGNPKM